MKRTSDEESIIGSVEALVNNMDIKIKEMKINESIEEIMQFVRSINKYMEHQKPWVLVKEDKNNAARVLYTAGESIRIAAVLLSPVMPNRCADVLHVFDSGKSTKWGQLKSGSKLNDHKALFPRISLLMLTDSHCHLFYEEILKDIDNVFKRSKELGVNRFICVGTNINDSLLSLDISNKYENVYCSAGIHPHDSENVDKDYIHQIELMMDSDKMIAVGEIGLDYFRNISSKKVK